MTQQLPSANHPPPTTNYSPPTTNYSPPTIHHLPPTTYLLGKEGQGTLVTHMVRGTVGTFALKVAKHFISASIYLATFELVFRDMRACWTPWSTM